MAAAAAEGGEAVAVQKALQAVAEGTGWTYAALWRLCTRQGALVWAEGHYNGAIKTRKTTVAPGGGGEEEEEEEGTAARRRRSRQLRELYDSLAAGAEADGGGGGGGGGSGSGREDGAVVARRSSAALAPEDLSETEWFYLMCGSYCFPPGLGLPGEAFARRGHVWLSGANKVNSKVFSRAILARSAGIQTVACIPVNEDGVLEIGTTEKVDEDIGLIEYARSIFMDQHGIPIMPTLSGHSTSTPSTHINHQPSQIKIEKYIGGRNVRPNNLNPEEEHIETEDDNHMIDSETNTENDSCRHLPLGNVGNGQAGPNARSSDEPMQIETSESLRDGCTNHVDEEIPMLMACQNGDHPEQDELGSWHFLYEDLMNNKCLQSSAAQDPAVLAENAHYIEAVLTILRHNACRQAQAAASNTRTYDLAISKNSPFSRWNPNKGTSDLQRMLISEGTPQRMLKSILFTSAPTRCSSHQRHRGEATQSPEEPAGRDDGDGTGRSRRGQGQAQAELSASHVLKERQRREKLNERFIILRSLVPFVTKMDRASILGDTIEYVKQLRRRIQDLESLRASKEKRAQSTSSATMAEAWSKVRAVEASSSCSTSGAGRPASVASTEVQVSIIESDALVELRCPRRDGLLLRVMQALHRELGLEVTSVQASSAGDVLLVELRAKVKEVHGGRSTINEVKRTIHLIISSSG
ncbi:transcription factor TT8 [Setaria italica]|uniref:transcription factor TT8 n=1 Tax=Setaria italica TaxID=4555 RepID=UPI000BE528EF|nr:transcription factor TT8 [Setaria italica]